MKARKTKAERGAGVPEFFRTLPKYRLPWLVIAGAFLFNVLFNWVLFKIPTTTAGLMSGKLSGSALWGAIGYYIGFAVLSSCQTFILGWVENFSVYRSRRSLWSKMLRIKQRYYDENNPSELMSAVTNDISQSIGFLVNVIIFTVPDTFYIVIALLEIKKYHVSLVLAMAAILPLKYIYMVVLGRYISRAMNLVYEKIGVMTGYLAERIHHLTHIKTFNGEPEELVQGRDVSEKLYKANMNIAKFECASNAASTVITVIEKLVVMMAAVVLLQKGIISMEQWVAFFLFSADISMKFDNFVAAWLRIKQVEGTARRSVGMMNAEEEKLAGKKKAEHTEDMSVVFDDVTFAYGEHEALRNVSFEVPEGSSVALVGLCGSGKTTALNLMERFYDVKSGEIRLGAESIADMELDEYRSRLSYVQQGADIFAGTVREALTYGIAREVSDEEILKAAEISGFSKYLKDQPDGLDTYLIAGGDSLSGGQNQRLVLAREFLRNAEIILMDEPTSALDVQTSEKIREMIKTMFAGKTKIVVTHDLELARNMDQIVVLENGDCAGRGSFEELLHGCELFREMVAAQEQGREAAECGRK